MLLYRVVSILASAACHFSPPTFDIMRSAASDATEPEGCGETSIRPLIQLVDLTLSDLEACRVFLPKRQCGLLKVRAATGADTKEASRASAEKRREEKLQYQQELAARMRHDVEAGSDTTCPLVAQKRPLKPEK